MKIAYIILAHSAPRHLERLVSILVGEGDHAILHIDAKADLDVLSSAFKDHPNVHFTPERTDMKWGSSSMMIAELNAFRTALKQVPDADYFWIVSGDSYPLRSPEWTRRFLEINRGREFINCIAMPANEEMKPIRRISHYRADFDARTDPRRVLKLIGFRLARRPYKHALAGLKPFGGSQWVCLTKDAVSTVIESTDSNPKLWKLATTSAHTDEWYLQTIVMNSPRLRDNVVPALFWADLRPTTPPPRPPILDHEQLAFLRSFLPSQAELGRAFLMGRKFNDESSELLDRIEHELWGINIEPFRQAQVDPYADRQPAGSGQRWDKFVARWRTYFG